MISRAFSYGEVSPSLQKRVDLDSYARSAKTLKNYIVKPEGGAETRAGSVMVAPTKYGSANFSATQRTCVLRPFIFNNDDANVYVLEIGHQYMRFHKNGAQIRTTAQVVSGITNASPGVLTYVGADPTNGDEFYISGVRGMEAINGEWVIVSAVDGTANTYAMLNRDTTNVATTAYGAYTSGGTMEKVYEITTTYSGADVAALSFAQNGDTIVIAHPDYAPRKLVRTSDTSWAISTITFTPSTSFTEFIAGVAGAGGTAEARYQVTVMGADGKESLPAYTIFADISAVTRSTTPEVTTSAPHGLATGTRDEVYFPAMTGMTELLGRRFPITVTGASKFTLDNVDTTSYGVFATGKYSFTQLRIAAADAPTKASPNTVSWVAVSGADSYVVYREKNGVFGYVGVAKSNQFLDTGEVSPDTADRPPRYAEPFRATGDYPSCVSFGKQRLLFGGPDNNPNRVRGSAVGDYYNFCGHDSDITVASDPITLDLLGGNRVQIVRSLREIAGRVVAFCSEGEFGLGDEEGVLDASRPDAKQSSANGSTSLPALMVSNIAVYVQARSSQVRDLGFSFDENSYHGEERSIRSKHLFKGHTIVDWCYQQVPNSTIYAVRDDGVVLACTYVREQQMAAWSRCSWKPLDIPDVAYAVKSVCSVPETDGDALYVVVDRRHIVTVERVDSRVIVDADSSGVEYQFSSSGFSAFAFVRKGLKELCTVDCAKVYDGRNANSALYMTIPGGQAPYDSSHSITIYSTNSAGTPAAYFNADDVGKMIVLYEQTNNNEQRSSSFCKFTIVTYNSATSVTGTLDRTTPYGLGDGLTGGITNLWSKAVNKVYGLRNLYSVTHQDSYVLAVAVVGDGFVEANPLNDDYEALSVASDFSVDFSRHYEVVYVGLPYICDLELLDIDSVQAPGGGLIHKKKVIDKMYVAVEESRGLYVGADAPDDDVDDPKQNLSPLIDRRDNDLSFDAPIPLQTDILEQDCISNWDSHGRCFIRALDPLPATVLAVMPDGVTFI